MSLSFRLRRRREGQVLGTPSHATEHANALDADPLADLLVKTAHGDRAAFKKVYEAAAPQLLGIALRLMRHRDQAEEVLQDSFLAIWQKAAQFADDRGSPMAWMATIVRHRAIDRLRASKRQPLQEALDEAQACETLCCVRAQAGSRLDVCDALATLPETYRQAVTLAVVEGLTHEELAIRLDAPLGTVKSWVRRGLLAMKESLSR